MLAGVLYQDEQIVYTIFGMGVHLDGGVEESIVLIVVLERSFVLSFCFRSPLSCTYTNIHKQPIDTIVHS